ncbi:FtsK/SpoIIIE domain-containing protein [Protofrankia symbiont of Coriaria ruscifolia]|uniref:FtsK/SpoIIIE domain-containing protein n=1 Tax=Protofrankia symbiont of Coriaria ruscifolia TaxID=1306542 RepID=UPI001040F266|nr:FtsK/SpoIIIE domain-containing protein [Protofrankia symbiont of Coriaria ruscifolia]
MSGTRRVRTLVTGIQMCLGEALSLADQLDALADQVELPGSPGSAPAGRVRPPGRRDLSEDAWHAVPGTADEQLPAAIGMAAAIAREQAPDLAGAPWPSPLWTSLGRAGRALSQARILESPQGRDRPRPRTAAERPYRPGLWRVGRVFVPPLLPGGDAAEMPLAVSLLDGSNLRVVVDRDRRAEGVGVVRGLLTRVLAAAPPGSVRVTVYDPYELGAGLAGFAPLRAAGVVSPTLTTRTRLEGVLGELSADVGRITVDRLGGRFASLREREAAGLPRAEPWRLLVLLAWPSLADDAARALEAITAQGPACGVHVIALLEEGGTVAVARAGHDTLTNAETLRATGSAGDSTGMDLPAGARGIPGGGPASAGIPATWRCSLSGPLECELDDPPPPELVAAVAESVAAATAVEAARPPDARALLPDTLWSFDAAGGLSVPVAFGPDGPVTLRFDDDTVHALVGGQAGSGKSTLLLDVVYGLAARYAPDQLRFHLLDFKEGLEFAQFAPRGDDPFVLPHADTIGMDSDREFGVAVLRHVRAQMQRRALAMRAVGARDLRGLRVARGNAGWPRIMVVIDEFQVMLTPLDAVSREAVSHLEVLARQGRAYGIHLLLASQTLSGIDALDATAGKRGSIFGQFALRIALRTSISESRVLLSTTNEAAGALAGVGEAIVNRRNGHPAGNELVRVAYPDSAVLATLRASLARASAAGVPGMGAPRVFVGHAPAVLDDNRLYRSLAGTPIPVEHAERDGGGGIEAGTADVGAIEAGAADDGTAVGEDTGAVAEPLALVGVPLDLHPAAVGVRLSPLPGRNLAVLGPLRREAVGALQAAVVSIAGQAAPGGVQVDIVAVTAETTQAADVLAERVRAFGQPAQVHPPAALRRVLRETSDEVRMREESSLAVATGEPVSGDRLPGDRAAGGPMRLLVLFAADAGRAVLEAKEQPARRSGLDDLRFVTRRGPGQRVHLLGWWRGPGRLLDDLGPMHRDDVGAWVAVGVPAGDLFSLAGNRSVTAGTSPNRAVLFDRHGHAEARTIVPFSPLRGQPGASGSLGGQRRSDHVFSAPGVRGDTAGIRPVDHWKGLPG